MPWLFPVKLSRALGLWAVAVLLAGIFSACSSGPLDPARLAQVKSRDEYVALAKAGLAHDEIYFLNAAGEALWVDILPLTADLLAAGRVRWSEDKRHAELLSQWLPAGPPARIVLVGLYAKGLVKDDVLKNGRFRFHLRVGGESLEPLAVEEVKPEVWGDYFPVFSRWEKVFALRFPASAGEGGALVIDWPAGRREVSLDPAALKRPRPAS
jgi:hypothetical protein